MGIRKAKAERKQTKMAKRNEEFIIPEMSNYDANEDAKNFENTHFEAMKGEESYVSPEEASPEAAKEIKKQKVALEWGNFISNVLGRTNEVH